MNNTIAKMLEKNVKDFSEEELDRVFKDCVSPIICKRRVKIMIKNGLTMEDVKNG